MNKEDEKKIPVTVEQVRQFLKENQDPEYREFHSKLLPGTENIMGVRLPILRKFAKQLAAQAWKDWFEQADDQWYEETMLRGLVVAYARMDCEERLKYVRKFVPDINSWGVCDCFCSTLKDADKYPQEINKPKIVIRDASFSNEIATINVDITFYNGERRKDCIKINYITHEVID